MTQENSVMHKPIPNFFILVSGVILICLAGCMKVGPDYVRPETDMVSQWEEYDDPAIVPEKGDIRNWWTVYNDPLLTSLILHASESNLDVRVAVARVQEARARLGAVTGDRWPGLDASGEVAREKASDNMGLGEGVRQTTYSASLGASWEMDLFGRIGRSIESAAAEYEATEEDKTDVLVTMYSELAKAYLNVRTFQACIEAARSNIASQRESLELTKVRFVNGLATDLEVAQAERVLANSESQIPPLKTSLTRSINTIDILLGNTPDIFSQELEKPAPIPFPDESITIGVPADLLRRRTDIRSAERRLAAQTAKIGVAKADLYPTFSLTGSFGLASTASGDFFSSGSQYYSYGLPIRWNLFSGGRIRNQIKAEDAKTSQLLFTYEKTVLNAFNEVENAITAYLEELKRYESLQKAVSASKRAVKLSTDLYKDGLTDYQNVLDAQRSLFDSENEMLTAKGNSAVYIAQLYKVLGGGWDADAETDDENTPDAETK